jgi:hypothetical protein
MNGAPICRYSSEKAARCNSRTQVQQSSALALRKLVSPTCFLAHGSNGRSISSATLERSTPRTLMLGTVQATTSPNPAGKANSQRIAAGLAKEKRQPGCGSPKLRFSRLCALALIALLRKPQLANDVLGLSKGCKTLAGLQPALSCQNPSWIAKSRQERTSRPYPKHAACGGKILALIGGIMPTYKLHIICPACHHAHPHGTIIELADGPHVGTTVKAAYPGTRVPVNLLLDLVKQVLCPKTEKPVRQIHLDKVFLLPGRLSQVIGKSER